MSRRLPTRQSDTGPADSGPADAPDETARLAELAEAWGVLTSYHDWRGQPVSVATETVVAVLAALGVDASGPAAVRAALAEHELRPWRRTLPPTVVTTPAGGAIVPVHVPVDASARLWIELEDGGRRGELARRDGETPRRMVDGRETCQQHHEIPAGLPLGWHTLHAVLTDPAEAGRAEAVDHSATLVVTPRRLDLPAALADPTGPGRAWGFMTQLYATVSRRSWGLGDFADLAELASWSAQGLGADFVLVNPVHAGGVRAPLEPSPYLPSSRRFPDPIYLRVEAIEEYGYLPAPEVARIAELAEQARAAAQESGRIERDSAWPAKLAALELVRRVARQPGREAEYAAFQRREGEGLRVFALQRALAERHGPDWQSWPRELRDPASPAVARAENLLADRIEFHTWLAWLTDQQLAAAQHRAESAGMAVGVLHDLAVGVHGGGADAWALRQVLAQGITAGAPPDAFNQVGQDWSQPPWRPDRLAEAGYAPYRDMLRAVLRHAGGIRVDHVMGLFRLWWVPAGQPASAGTYVRYDDEAMVGILALEASRARAGRGALVVGEDLGVVEPRVRESLAERGILGTSILWFEHDEQGRPRRPQQWRELCLATVTTHDLPPTAGYLAGEHVRLRDELGLLARPVAVERAADEADRDAWLALLVELGLLRPGAGEREIVEALHRLLTWTPCRLIGVALPDAVGDRRTQNLPGTSAEYPNWRMPLADQAGARVWLEDLPDHRRLRSLAAVLSSICGAG